MNKSFTGPPVGTAEYNRGDLKSLWFNDFSCLFVTKAAVTVMEWLFLTGPNEPNLSFV